MFRFDLGVERRIMDAKNGLETELASAKRSKENAEQLTASIRAKLVERENALHQAEEEKLRQNERREKDFRVIEENKALIVSLEVEVGRIKKELNLITETFQETNSEVSKLHQHVEKMRLSALQDKAAIEDAGKIATKLESEKRELKQKVVSLNSELEEQGLAMGAGRGRLKSGPKCGAPSGAALQQR